MYTYHEGLNNISDKVNLWKFMDLPKFINLLNGKMYFNRLNNFEDVYEGTYPNGNLTMRDEVYSPEERMSQATYDKLANKAQNNTYVSCFHNSKSETAFMWNIYGKEGGIAIKTTGKRLKESFSLTDEDIYIGKVSYIDYNRDYIPESNLLYLGTYKRKSFSAEKEFRCLVFDSENIKYGKKTGILIDVDLNQLIMGLYVSPYAPDYLTDDLNKILMEKGIRVKAQKSDLLKIN